MKLKINYKNQTYEVEIEKTQQIRQLRFNIEREVKLKACQQRLWILKGEEQIVLEVDKTIEEYQITEETAIYMKDLGKQLPFRFVYITEYVVPLILYIFIFLIAKASGKIIYNYQYIALFMHTIHYIKR